MLSALAASLAVCCHARAQSPHAHRARLLSPLQVLAALRHHSADADVQSLGCAALRNVTCGDDAPGLSRKQVRGRACRRGVVHVALCPLCLPTADASPQTDTRWTAKHFTSGLLLPLLLLRRRLPTAARSSS